MYSIDCPHCGKTQTIQSDDLPEHSCDSEERECTECGETFEFGWRAEVEIR